MPDPGACTRGLPPPDGFSESGRKAACLRVSSLPFLNWGAAWECWGPRCSAVLCCVAGLGETLPHAWVWKMFGLGGTADGPFGFFKFVQALIANVFWSGRKQ